MTLTEARIPKHLYKYIIALFLITLFLRIVLISYYYGNYGGIEQNVIYGIQRILLGQQLYQDPASGSYAVMQYTPLWYYFIAGIARLTGVTGTDVQSIYILCRVWALIFNLLTVCVCALMIRSSGFSRLLSLVFAMPVLIFLTSHYYTRGDSMHLFMFAGAIYAYIRYSKTGGLQHIVLSALFSAGCIMAKQSGILIFGIIGCCLFIIERKPLVAVFYCLCILCFGWLIAISCIDNWHLFYKNAFLGLKDGIDTSFLYKMFINQFFLGMVPCYILGGMAIWLSVRRVKDKTYRILAIGAVVSFLFAVVTGLKRGSSNNYFIEFLLFVIGGLPYLLQSEAGAEKLFKVSNYVVSIRRFACIAFFILIISRTAGLFMSVYIEKTFKSFKTEYVNEQELDQYFKNIIGIKDGEHIFFTDRLFFDNIFIEHAIMPAKDVVSQVYAADPNTFDYSAFIAGMNSGLVKYIVTDKKCSDINECNKTIPFILFDKSKFKLLSNYLGYSIYIYSPAS